jgi:microcystin degradation protein MlrC
LFIAVPRKASPWATVWVVAGIALPSSLDSVPVISIFVYPHTDGYERAIQASALAQSAMKGRKKPRCLLKQPAMLEGADFGRTSQPGLMRDLLALADKHETELGINVISIQAGFTWSDIPWTGHQWQ